MHSSIHHFILGVMSFFPFVVCISIWFKKKNTELSVDHSKEISNYDVIIIGAGISGLTAARELIRLGRSVIILEASSRIGGRAHTVDIQLKANHQQVPIDAGAAWIHGISTNPLTGVVDAMGYTRTRTIFETPFFIKDKRATKRQMTFLQEASDYIANLLTITATKEQYEEAVNAIVDEDRNICNQIYSEFSEFINQYSSNDKRFEEILPLIKAKNGPLENACEFHHSSAVDLSQFASGQDDLLKQGLGTFVNEFGKNIPVKLSSPVTKIIYGNDKVIIKVQHGKTYNAKRVLVTVSTGVLNQGNISFNPPLPQWKIDAIKSLPMGHFQKIIIPLKTSAFIDEESNSWILYQGPVESGLKSLAKKYHKSVMYEENYVMAFLIKPFGYPIAIAHFGGEWAEIFEQDSAEQFNKACNVVAANKVAINIALKALSNIFLNKDEDVDINELVDKNNIKVTQWSSEPYILGAYSYSRPGKWQMREVLAKPIGAGINGEGTLQVFFSGEATSKPIFNGSLAGAYQSGLEAAGQIHQSLQKAS